MCRLASAAHRQINVKEKRAAKSKSITEQISFNNMLQGNQNISPLIKSKIYLCIIKGIAKFMVEKWLKCISWEEKAHGVVRSLLPRLHLEKKLGNTHNRHCFFRLIS